MLTVREIVELPGLDFGIAVGGDALENQVSWAVVSELSDPTRWLEGGELLLTTGLGVGKAGRAQREYVRRLSEHGLAGLGFGVGFGWAKPPAALVAEAERLGFPVVIVPYELPFIAVTKAVAARLANEQLSRIERALEVHARLAAALLEGRGIAALLTILGDHVGCSLALVDESGRVLGERHAARLAACPDVVELPVTVNGTRATLRAGNPRGRLGEYDRLVLHHGQTALAFELARRHAVSAAELRLAGDLLDDLENDRLDEREIGRRIAAFGLDPQLSYAALLAVSGEQQPDALRAAAALELDASGVRYVSAARRDRAAFLVAHEQEDAVLSLARSLAAALPGTRVGVGRPGRGAEIGRSLLDARAALDILAGPVASYRDLGSLELLLGLPTAMLEGFVTRVLGPMNGNIRLLESLAALLDSGCRWSEAADGLGVHRHTLRYRMEQLRKQTGRHPDDPAQRMELWLALKAQQALAARSGVETGEAPPAPAS